MYTLPKQITRPYVGLFSAAFGGIGLVGRVRNDNASIAEWANVTSARVGFPVSQHVSPSNRTFAWLIEDVAPRNSETLAFLGLDVSGSSVNRAALEVLGSNATGSEVQSGLSQAVAVTGIFTLPTAPPLLGFAMYSTVFEDDPTRVVIVAASVLAEYDAIVFAGSPLVAVVVVDHTGYVYASPSSACALDSADQVLTKTMNVTQSQQWTVLVGQCPEFTSQQLDGTTGRYNAWVYIAGINVAAVVAIAAVLLSVYMHEKDVVLRIAIAKHEESTRAHRWIIGYGTRGGGWVGCAWGGGDFSESG